MRPEPDYRESLAWIAERQSPEPNTGCWLWTGGVDKDGYGARQFRDSRRLLVHRAMLAAKLGRALRDDECACHRCDNRLCSNPDHLFVGDRAANLADMFTKKRHAYGQGKSHLTDDDVTAIKRRYAAGERQASLATEFGVGSMQISRIVNGREWAHHPGRPERRGATLSVSQVMAIRVAARSGTSQRELANRFGCSGSTISRVVTGVRWASLPMEESCP